MRNTRSERGASSYRYTLRNLNIVEDDQINDKLCVNNYKLKFRKVSIIAIVRGGGGSTKSLNMMVVGRCTGHRCVCVHPRLWPKEVKFQHCLYIYLYSYKIIEPESQEFGTRLPTGNFTGMMKLIQRKVAIYDWILFFHSLESSDEWNNIFWA